MLTQNQKEKIRAAFSRYPDNRSAVMDALSLVQKDGGGSLTRGNMEDVAEFLSLNPVEVQAVAAFYSLYQVEKPVGKYHIQMCRTLSCTLMGAEEMLGYIEKKLGIQEGKVTPDGKFSLTTVECLGSCGTAPMMQINDDYYEDLTPERIDEILDGFP